MELGEILKLAVEREEPVKEPAKRWRNWWRMTMLGVKTCPICGNERLHFIGGMYESHCETFPSKYVAETHAASKDEGDYIGAFPDGERP